MSSADRSRTVMLALAASLLTLPALAVEVMPEPFSDAHTVADWPAAQRQALDRLEGEMSARPSKAAAQVRLTQADKQQIATEREEAEAAGTPPVVGLVKSIDLAVDLASATKVSGASLARSSFGLVQRLGGRLSAVSRVDALDSGEVRLRLDDVYLPEGAELYLLNDSGDVRGPYVDREGSFWTHSIPGGTLYLQVSQPETGAKPAHFSVGAALLLDIDPQAFCSANAACVEDASCFDTSDWGAIDAARGAIAVITFVVDDRGRLCTGGLLNDTDSTTKIPYFLTANHCLSTSEAAATVEARFQYRTSSCGASCNTSSGITVAGATLLDTSATDDHTLLRLNEAPPDSAWLLGWSSTPVAYSSGTRLYRLSHPKGSPQAYSVHSVSTTAGTCYGAPRGSFIYSRDLIGATEVGSSGAPVMLESGQVVGQLYGACGASANVCDSASNAALDGAFASYYSRVAKWLDPPVAAAEGDSAGLYSPADSNFHLRYSNTRGEPDAEFQFYTPSSGWIPLAGDWNGSGQATVGLFNRSNSHFYLRNSNTAGSADLLFQYGSSSVKTWIPLVGDWDGNGTATPGFFDPSRSLFYLRNSNTAGKADLVFQYGSSKNPHWIPVVGDWDGNGTTTVGLFNPDNSYFYLRNSNTSGKGELVFQFGSPRISTWIPLAGDWDGNGQVSIGLFNSASGIFYLRNSPTAGVADLTFKIGSPGSAWKPVVGHWTSP